MYIVMELQKDREGRIANVVTVHPELNGAESKFHQVLAYAAVSEVPVHAAALFSEEGFPMRHECYRHDGATTAPQD